MNITILMGRITDNPEIRYTPQGTAVCTFNLAVDRGNGKNETDFPTVVAWGKTAEFLGNYITKGRKLVIEGEIRTRNYEDKNGQKRKATEIQANRIEAVDSKPKDEQPPFN